MYPEVLLIEEGMQTHQAARSQRTDLVPPLENSEAVLETVSKMSLYESMREIHGNVFQPFWEAGLTKEALAKGIVLQKQSDDVSEPFK